MKTPEEVGGYNRFLSRSSGVGFSRIIEYVWSQHSYRFWRHHFPRSFIGPSTKGGTCRDQFDPPAGLNRINLTGSEQQIRV